MTPAGKYIKILYIFLLFCSENLYSQIRLSWVSCFNDDVRKPFYKIDFGSGYGKTDLNIFPLENYKADNTVCPDDGGYSYISQTPGCFNNDWFELPEDHTPEDVSGRMMIVNASEEGGIFLYTPLGGFKQNKQYIISFWLMNICRIGGGCKPLPPNISTSIKTPSGEYLTSFKSGPLQQSANPEWRQCSSWFVSPKNGGSVLLIMEDVTLGGCGNDFALDDIEIFECNAPEAVRVKKIKSPAKEKNIVKTPLVAKNKTIRNSAPKTVINPQTKFAVKVPDVVLLPPSVGKITEGKVLTPIPAEIADRESPVVKRIVTEKGEMKIEVYDNGEIDGDTISIFHNSELMISKRMITATPLTFKINIDNVTPHHELLMVAENLGTIPPNTSLMIMTINGTTYRTFISASDKKNAKLIIDLKK